MEGLRAALKGLGPLLRRWGSALAHGCGRGGRAVLPLARAAALWTGSRVQGQYKLGALCRPHLDLVRVRVRVRIRVIGLGVGLGLGLGL